MFEHRRQSKKYRRHRRSILSTTLKHYRGGALPPPEPTVADERNDIYNTPTPHDLMTPPSENATPTNNFITPQSTTNNTPAPSSIDNLMTPPPETTSNTSSIDNLMTPPPETTSDTSSIDNLMTPPPETTSDISMNDQDNSIKQSPPSPVDNILAGFKSSTPSLSLETPEEPQSTAIAAAAPTTTTTIQLNYDEMMNDPEIEPVIKTLIQKLGDYLQKRTKA